MARKTTSIRGQTVDFDLFLVKEQILNTPKTEDTKKRERFIDKKRRRTTRHSIDQLLSQQQQNEAAVRQAMAASKKAPLEAVVEAPVAAPETVEAQTSTTDVEAPARIIKKK